MHWKTEALSQKDGFDLVLTGTSLGGGIAAMLGSVEGGILKFFLKFRPQLDELPATVAIKWY